MPGIVLRSASLAVFRSSGSWAALSSLAAGLVSLLAGAGAALGAWAQTVGAASMPVENSTATSRAINRFMTGLLDGDVDLTPPGLEHGDPGASKKGGSSANAQQLHLEDERGARRDDSTGSPVTVAQVRGDDQLPLAAHLHRDDALVPALDDAPLADRELERAAAVHRAVELRAALEPAGVVHAHCVAGLRPGSGALDQVHVAEPGCRLHHLVVGVIAHDWLSFGGP